MLPFKQQGDDVIDEIIGVVIHQNPRVKRKKNNPSNWSSLG
jgi:hypothetical protein